MGIMSQARSESLVIDPYVDEDLLDMFASLDASVSIRVLTEHLKGNFKAAFRKLQQPRGGIEVRCSSQLHDRFIVVDGRSCHQLGGSINRRRKGDHNRGQVRRDPRPRRCRGGDGLVVGCSGRVGGSPARQGAVRWQALSECRMP